MKPILFSLLVLLALAGCSREAAVITDDDLLREAFVTPPAPQRANSTVLNPAFLPIASDADHLYLRMVQNVFLDNRRNWSPTAALTVDILEMLERDRELSEAERSNQIHTIGYMFYGLLREHQDKPEAGAYSAEILRLMLDSRAIDYGTMAVLLDHARGELSDTERTAAYQYILNGANSVLRKGEPSGNQSRADLILWQSSQEATLALGNMR